TRGSAEDDLWGTAPGANHRSSPFTTNPGRTLGASTALGVMLALATHGPPARADCVADCRSSTYCDSQMEASGECGRKLNGGYLSQCNRPQTSYGAIAYGAESTAYGYAYDQPSESAAGRRALSDCRKHGDDCRLVVSFSNGCAALAAGDGETFAVAQGSSRKQ